MKNEFKQGIPTKQHQHYEAISKTIGRDARPTQKLNPPVFEDATISLHKKGLFWLNAIIRTEFRRF